MRQLREEALAAYNPSRVVSSKWAVETMTQIHETGEDTNERVQNLEKQLVALSPKIGDLHRVLIDGQPPRDEATPSEVLSQSRCVKALWSTRVDIAKQQRRDEAVKEKEDRAFRMEVAVDRQRTARETLVAERPQGRAKGRGAASASVSATDSATAPIEPTAKAKAKAAVKEATRVAKAAEKEAVRVTKAAEKAKAKAEAKAKGK
jgi:hypothetical protein